MNLRVGDHVQVKREAPGLDIPHLYRTLGILQVADNEPREGAEGSRQWHVRAVSDSNGQRSSHLIDERYLVKV